MIIINSQRSLLMLQIIRKGDKTTHGGSVLTASETMKFGGIGVARKGDKVSCPVPGHGPTTALLNK